MTMTLYDALQWENQDFDTTDTVYDLTVTVCADEYNRDDNYDRWCKFILEHVMALEKWGGDRILADWSGFITANIEVFREHARENWYRLPEDDDDLVYEWIQEIEKWMAGYATEEIYGEFMEKYAPRIKEV